jgi:hypothetical protein
VSVNVPVVEVIDRYFRGIDFRYVGDPDDNVFHSAL